MNILCCRLHRGHPPTCMLWASQFQHPSMAGLSLSPSLSLSPLHSYFFCLFQVVSSRAFCHTKERTLKHTTVPHCVYIASMRAQIHKTQQTQHAHTRICYSCRSGLLRDYYSITKCGLEMSEYLSLSFCLTFLSHGVVTAVSGALVLHSHPPLNLYLFSAFYTQTEADEYQFS